MRGILLGSAIVMAAGAAHASDCNFERPSGTCVGTVSLDSSGGSAPSYSAEITVQSSAPSCSKVMYSIDGMSQTTFLRANSEHESLFGPKPITKDGLKVVVCTAFTVNAAPANAESRPTAPADAALSVTGSWQFKIVMSDIQGEDYRIKIKERDGKITGSGTLASNISSHVERTKQTISGTRNGNEISADFKSVGSPRGTFFDRQYKFTVEGETMKVVDPFGRAATAVKK